MKKNILLLLSIFSLFSCKNDDWDFPDNAYNAVYFSYQYPVRTITLGEDIFDTSLDNQGKCKIMATWGGGYTNKSDVEIDIKVEESLANNLKYTNGTNVLVMPSNYYKLQANKILIPKGSISGGVEVQLTDAFFADPLALERNYVIPLLMTNVKGADRILSGKSDELNPNRVVSTNWGVLPKDYTLYAVKYINTWEANYLRRGTDVVTNNGVTSTVVRREKYVEQDQVTKLKTVSLSKIQFPITYKDAAGNNIPVSLVLDFDQSGACTITSGTENISASGTGKFVKRGEKKSWGDKDRDALYLNYNVVLGAMQYSTKDTLVVRDRGVAKETFDVVVN